MTAFIMKEKTLVTLKDGISLEYPFSDEMPMIYLRAPLKTS